MKPVTIYALVDPRNDVPRYVGQTQDPSARRQNHRSKPVNQRVRAWLSELQQLGLEPRFDVIRVVDQPDADNAEYEAMQAYRRTVLNIGPAGTGRRSGPRRPIQRPRPHLVALCQVTHDMLVAAAGRLGITASEAIALATAEWCQRQSAE